MSVIQLNVNDSFFVNMQFLHFTDIVTFSVDWRICMEYSIFPKDWPFCKRCSVNFELLLLLLTANRCSLNLVPSSFLRDRSFLRYNLALCLHC